MKLKELDIPKDIFLAEELQEDILVEMANLAEKRTGVKGFIFVSTAMGNHGPRVKYYLKAGRAQPSFSVSISDAPMVVGNNLPVRVKDEFSPYVIKWINLNKTALLDFWYHGDEWDTDKIESFWKNLLPINN